METETLKKELERIKYLLWQKDCIIESKNQLINDLDTVLSNQGNIKLNEQQINSFIFGIGINSENRLERFYFWSKFLPSHLYLKYLSEVYTVSDNLYKFKDQVKELFNSTLPERELLMTKKELKYLKSLPDNITICRAMTVEESISKDYGVSWTLNKKVAEFFRNKYERNFDTNGKPKIIIELEINKNDVIAFFNERKEKEIIYLNKLASINQYQLKNLHNE